MSKSLPNYFAFAVACLAVTIAFVTATTYIQLVIAITLYPLLIFFVFKAFPRQAKAQALRKPAISAIEPSAKPAEVIEKTKKGNESVSDIDKRTFLKLIGATGISFFLISIFGRRAESLLFGQNFTQTPIPTSNNLRNNQDSVAAVSPTEGYKISEIDDNIIGYYGFTNPTGEWFIMKEDPNTGSFRYTKGNSDFPGNWNKRENLKYDYFYNVFSRT